MLALRPERNERKQHGTEHLRQKLRIMTNDDLLLGLP
jgi:hypothetical protein